MALRSWVVVVVFLLSALACGGEETSVKRLVALDYPPIAAQARIQGEVVVRCTVNDDGDVQGTVVMSGHAVLSKVARENAAKWAFSPATASRGESRGFTLIYRFRLEGVCFAPNCTSSFYFEYPNRATVVTQARHWTPAAAREGDAGTDGSGP
jgi:TonB family protein